MLLEAINVVRSGTRVCVNGQAALPAVGPVVWNGALAAAADRHSADMAENDVFDHNGSDGSTPAQRITDAGYRWSAWGENIAGGYTTTVAVVRGWLDSPGHCAIIMQANFKDFGASCRYDAASTYGYYWTADFGSR